jgi:hypothetical protein
MISCTASRASGPDAEILTTGAGSPSPLIAPSTYIMRAMILCVLQTSPPREIVTFEQNREAVFTIRAHMLALPMKHLNTSSRFTFREVLTVRCYWLAVGGQLGQPPPCVYRGSSFSSAATIDEHQMRSEFMTTATGFLHGAILRRTACLETRNEAPRRFGRRG